MSIKVNVDKCVGCKKCVNVCPGNLLYMNQDKKAYIKYPKDCWGCTACLKECAFGAIEYYLGTDIGGRGASMYTKKEKNLLHWHIKKADNSEKIITVNSEESNKY